MAAGHENEALWNNDYEHAYLAAFCVPFLSHRWECQGGKIAVGPLPEEAVRGLIKAVKAATDGPLNVNFITILAIEAQIRACIDEGVSVVSFHWGHPPGEFVAWLHEAGIKVWEQVGSVDGTKEAVDSGIDLIIAQGSEAGGHNYGSLPTFVLVPSILEAAAPTPVLAAGGIATGRQLCGCARPRC